MVPVGRGVRREYAGHERSFTCCVGTGMESHALHGHGLYYESRGQALGQPLRAVDRGVEIRRREADAWRPTSRKAIGEHCRLQRESPKQFTLALRRPSWAGDAFAVKVNGEASRSVPTARLVRRDQPHLEDGDTVVARRCPRRCASSRCPTTRTQRPSCGARWSSPATSVRSRGRATTVMAMVCARLRRSSGAASPIGSG